MFGPTERFLFLPNHIPRERRSRIKIENFTAYTLDEGDRRVARGEIDVTGAVVIIDNLTNDVRGTRQRTGATPEDLLFRVDRLRRRVLEAGAEAIVVCEVKPMRHIDVSAYNRILHHYLRAQGGHGYGCMTQIRLEYLKADGFHVLPQFDPVIDKTYACAVMGIPVPCPTPRGGFVSDMVRKRWEREWPQVGARSDSRQGGEGLTQSHGWNW